METYLSSTGVSYLSNLLSGFLQEAVGLSQIFWSLIFDYVTLARTFVLSLLSKMSLSFGILKGPDALIALLMGGN